MKCEFEKQLVDTGFRAVRGKPGKLGKRAVFSKSQGKPGRVRESCKESSLVRESQGTLS